MYNLHYYFTNIIEEFANKIDKNKATVYRKINDNGDNFTIKEVDRMIKALKISSPDEITSIFFYREGLCK
ncbi:MAG: XRE family transcriptional regulator [Firmicutes bacterium]|nr:XRE family transcriptional regulator [Bacillota bacterium]